ncbi:MarR family winged helix-turn-helix transcriptional regulator [Gluconobacter sphaericus]|uniref:MarR family winged helix-turn-helix transcriptional regulator n=1 Tax=Gluconobacter sphaericus TaxID=574987 RepID=UPI001B8D38D4|nr:winged helix DNA-binding protein [Gluconobacter sphaericus]MBS1087261.1 winged helix DNA-binding protein [Gluconobacter sphaericus]MBS1101311.1 winged helix DNA-binding protein [Gluconobacter sphaericus]
MANTKENTAVAAWAALRNMVLNDEAPRKQVSHTLGISYFKVKVILKLLDGALSASRLVQDLASEKTYISLILRDLEADGTIVRQTSPSDRRYKEISLTPAGCSLAKQAQAILDQPPEGFCRLMQCELDSLLQLAKKISEP